jgi:hypothetical protein
MGAPFVERFFANVDPIEVSQLMSQLGLGRSLIPGVRSSSP